MYPVQPRSYEDSELSGLGVGRLISQEWRTGRHASVADVTTAVHGQRPDIPRSVIFWLAYHAVASDGPAESCNSGQAVKN